MNKSDVRNYIREIQAIISDAQKNPWVQSEKLCEAQEKLSEFLDRIYDSKFNPHCLSKAHHTDLMDIKSKRLGSKYNREKNTYE